MSQEEFEIRLKKEIERVKQEDFKEKFIDIHITIIITMFIYTLLMLIMFS